MAFNYTWEKFHSAVCGLVFSQQSLQQRIADAYIYHLSHAEHDGLPLEIQEDFRKLSEALLRHRAKGNEGSVAASAEALSELEAHNLLNGIVSMYDRVTKYGPNR